MTAATVGALAAAGAKAGRTASGVMKTPLAHVSTDLGPLHLEGNITPWTCVIGVLMGSTAGVYYKYYKQYGKAVAARALAHTVPVLMRRWEAGAQAITKEAISAKTTDARIAAIKRAEAYQKAWDRYSKWLGEQLGYTGTYPVLPWMMTAKAQEVLAGPKTPHDPPNVAEAFGAAIATMLMDTMKGIGSMVGNNQMIKTYQNVQLAGSPLLWGLKQVGVI